MLVRQSLYREMDQSITQTAALLANQVELENGKVTFEWQEGLGSNESLLLKGLFQFWDNRSGQTTRSPALQTRDLPKFEGKNGAPLVKNIVLPNGSRALAVGLRVYPFVLPDEMEAMHRRGAVIDPEITPPHAGGGRRYRAPAPHARLPALCPGERNFPDVGSRIHPHRPCDPALAPAHRRTDAADGGTNGTPARFRTRPAGPATVRTHPAREQLRLPAGPRRRHAPTRTRFHPARRA